MQAAWVLVFLIVIGVACLVAGPMIARRLILQSYSQMLEGFATGMVLVVVGALLALVGFINLAESGSTLILVVLFVGALLAASVARARLYHPPSAHLPPDVTLPGRRGNDGPDLWRR